MTETTGTHFRKASWGMSRAQVQGLEESELFVDVPDALTFRGEMLGIECLIRYEFSGDRLVSGSYYFNREDDQVDAEVYARLKEALDGEYGEGTERLDWLTLDRVAIRSASELGTAVAAGKLEAFSTWEDENARILLALENNKGKDDAQVMLVYRDPNADEPLTQGH